MPDAFTVFFNKDDNDDVNHGLQSLSIPSHVALSLVVPRAHKFLI